MRTLSLPEPEITLSQTEARRFVLAHQGLWPPRALVGKEGVLRHIRRVGCIQYDPIDVVGRNCDLVLQSRVAGYRRALLTDLLYTDRLLWDGWDKMQSVYPSVDYPAFARHRARMVEQWGDSTNPAMQVVPLVRDAVRERGPLCSHDLEHRDTLRWTWGTPTRLSRAALETLYAMGELGIHHRVATRRYFDRVERLLPADLPAAPDPNTTLEDYQDWHVLRRVGGLGLAQSSGSAECWLGILGVKAEARKAALRRLADRGLVAPVAVEGVRGRTFFLRTSDHPILEAVQSGVQPDAHAALLAPLDNLLWDRDLVRRIFGFDYIWEVYKPAAQRQYGYYVLPVLYGDRLVARVDPAFDKKARTLNLRGWWWEAGVQPDAAMLASLSACISEFARFLDARRIVLTDSAAQSLPEAAVPPMGT